MNILLIAGARPNFMKIAPLMAAFKARPFFKPALVHTGQHYDEKMSDLFFRQLGIPEPDVNLGVGSGSHAVQTAEIMKRFEPVMQERKPDAVLVVGDVNSTIACGLVAVKMGARLIHVEAGLRSFDRGMPEEINRLLTDSISDLLFCSEPAGVENLRREGVPESRICLAGNVMIDTLLRNKAVADRSGIVADLGLVPKRYAVLTLHRPSNVDDPATLDRLMTVLDRIAGRLPIVFPIHPRTRAKLESLGGLRTGNPAWKLIEPQGYLEFLKLMSEAKLVLTDSGGIQEETTILGVPCVTLRENTERPITVEMGTNRLAGTDPDRILAATEDILAGRWKTGSVPPLWDGRAAERMADFLTRWNPS
jgi:UDP-N-acetylglucosamine 2-epimerase (non-hydrolysing)